MLKDLKEALTTNRKPDITQVRKHFVGYTARTAEYGNDKYERANYLRPTGGSPHNEPTGADFKRLRVYARAAMGHLGDMLQMMEMHQAGDPQLLDVEGMKRAAYAVDTDETPGNPVGPSLLPHIAPACTSLMMAIEQAVACGLLPADPGTPWKVNAIKWQNVESVTKHPVKVYRTSGDELIADGFNPNGAAVANAQAAFAPSKPGTLVSPITEATYTSYARVALHRPATYQAGGDPGDEQPGKGPWAVDNDKAARAISFPAGSFGPVTVTLMEHEPGARWEDAARAHDERDNTASDLAGLAARESAYDALADKVGALALSMREINARATATMPSDCVGHKLATLVFQNPDPLPADLRTGLKGKATPGDLIVRLHTDPIAADFVPHDVDLTRDQVEALPDGTPIRVMWLGTEKWQSEAFGSPLVKGTSNVGVVCARAQHGDRFELVGTLATINPEGLRVRLADQKVGA